MFMFCGGTLQSLSPDSSGQLDVFWHDGDSPGMNGTQIGVFEQPHEIGLRCFLETLLTGTTNLSCSPLAISLTNLWKGSFQMRSAVLFWK